MTPELDRVSALAAQAARSKAFDAVYLLGMGGSSLCAEVMRAVFGIGEGHPDIFVLDTTDERTITGAAAQLDPAQHAVPRREQERRHGRSRVDGEASSGRA